MDHQSNGRGHDFEIQRETAASPYIAAVIAQLLPHSLCGFVVPVPHLRQPCDSGEHNATLVVPGHDLDEALDNRGTLRARSDDTHFPSEHVHDLRQLVQVGAAQDPADARHPGICLGTPHRSAFALGVLDHAPELVHPEYPAVEANPCLCKEDRSTALERDRETDHTE